MPHYDYVCRACGHEAELFQTISAKPLKKCPECGKAKFERLLGTGGGLLFKGSGFYLTDYRESDKPPAQSPSKPASSEKPAEKKAPESKKSDEK